MSVQFWFGICKLVPLRRVLQRRWEFKMLVSRRSTTFSLDNGQGGGGEHCSLTMLAPLTSLSGQTWCCACLWVTNNHGVDSFQSSPKDYIMKIAHLWVLNKDHIKTLNNHNFTKCNFSAKFHIKFYFQHEDKCFSFGIHFRTKVIPDSFLIQCFPWLYHDHHRRLG